MRVKPFGEKLTVVNSDYAVFDKAVGASVAGPIPGNALWQSLGGACATDNSGDPIAQYDKQAGRWVMMQLAHTKPYYRRIAVSQTSNATGKFNLYQFLAPNNRRDFADYPKLAVGPDGYYISHNRVNQLRYTAAEGVEGEFEL
jgi:hypothetical protein